MKKYFVYSADAGFETFKTEGEAKAYAEKCLGYYEEAAQFDGEWPEETDSVVWGKILGGAVSEQIETDSWRYKLKEIE